MIKLLHEKHADVVYHDPYIPHFVDDGMTLESVSDLMAEVRKADAVVIITNHKAYDYPAILNAANLIVDTRNALGDLGKANPKVVRL